MQQQQGCNSNKDANDSDRYEDGGCNSDDKGKDNTDSGCKDNTDGSYKDNDEGHDTYRRPDGQHVQW
ncbi:hypothetical protein CVT25_009442 [Psilocybe cyanescens]|uniref:Uncharacterized protein n=1 Tax=Psilocybe cyanescens TaxID=93625 RepID=A0A409X8F1_PSICY|nr:hypothetical protein CVT25_009442 [Psilocybe cyanescens]